jgi:hypothetical protein
MAMHTVPCGNPSLKSDAVSTWLLALRAIHESGGLFPAPVPERVEFPDPYSYRPSRSGPNF